MNRYSSLPGATPGTSYLRATISRLFSLCTASAPKARQQGHIVVFSWNRYCISAACLSSLRFFCPSLPLSIFSGSHRFLPSVSSLPFVQPPSVSTFWGMSYPPWLSRDSGLIRSGSENIFCAILHGYIHQYNLVLAPFPATWHDSITSAKRPAVHRD